MNQHNEPGRLGFVSSKELAEHLGVSRRWVLQQTRLGQLPGVKVGKFWFYRLAEVERSISARV